jgi:hypothetical protein
VVEALEQREWIYILPRFRRQYRIQKRPGTKRDAREVTNQLEGASGATSPEFTGSFGLFLLPFGRPRGRLAEACPSSTFSGRDFGGRPGPRFCAASGLDGSSTDDLFFELEGQSVGSFTR